MATPMGGTPVQQNGSIEFTTAETIAQYRIVLTEIE
jgi:hypothetical protein